MVAGGFAVAAPGNDLDSGQQHALPANVDHNLIEDRQLIAACVWIGQHCAVSRPQAKFKFTLNWRRANLFARAGVALAIRKVDPEEHC